MLQNSFFKKKDVINITPFLDIMLVLFVIIIVAASFTSSNVNKNKEKQLLSKISELKKQNFDLKKLDKKLKKEIVELKKINKTLNKQRLALFNENKNLKKIIAASAVQVKIYSNFLELNGIKYNFNDLKKMIEKGIIKRVKFYYAKDKKAIENYKEINKFLDELGWDIH